MRELVLTGHKDLWPVNEEESLFLGVHCFCYNHKYEFQDQHKFRIVPSPWRNSQDIFDSVSYIDRLYNRIIPKLAGIMNDLYNLSYSEKFWNAYMVLWLYNWLSIVYDRYRRLECAAETIGKERFVVKILNEYDPAVTDFWSFMSKITEGHYHNLLLMSDIINHAQFDFLDCRKVSALPKAVASDKKLSFKNSLKDFLASSKMNIWEYLNSLLASSLFLGTTYGLSLIDRMYLQFSRDTAFLFKKRLTAPVKANKVTRNDLNKIHLEFGAKNRFERIVEEMLLKHMPDALLMVDKYCAEIYPDIKTWVGIDIYKSQKKCFEIAAVLERGGRWISSQHGGGYGQFLSFPTGKIEYDITREFITWGWKHNHMYDAAFYPLPSPMLSRLKKHKEKEDSIILVSTIMSVYTFRLDGFLAPELLIDYMRAKSIFLGHLDKEILKKIKYKSHFCSYGIRETEFVEKMLSKDQILTEGRLTGFFSRARLAVIDHPATGFLESLAMNVPTILHWDPRYFTYCAAAAPYFEKLRSVGILYDSPQAAAQKINEIWPYVSEWWSDSDIQHAKDDFCFQFARSQSDWRNEWARFIKNL